MNVLILGNGLSRLSFDKEIREYPGEVWGCNNIYIDYGDKLTAIAGHDWCMKGASKARKINGYKYKIIGGLQWGGDVADESFTCDPRFRENTGTTLVAEALTRGYNVEACGFDMGGLDVYSPGHEKRNKTVWVKRWREIIKEFGHNRITFWGHDHMRFLRSNRSANEYYKLYARGKSHIPREDYESIRKTWGSDYTRILEICPCVMLKNIGQREYKIVEHSSIIKSGDMIKFPEDLAQKYVDAYPKDFRILPLNEND